MKTNTATSTQSPRLPWLSVAIALAFTVAVGNINAQALPDSWAAGPNLPTNMVRAAGVYFPTNGLFYAVGGRSADTAGSDLTHPYEYSPTTNAWTIKGGTYPDNQVNNMACGTLTVGGTPQIYCVGGSAAGQTVATARVFSYNPVTDIVTPLTAADNWPGNTGAVLPGGFVVTGNKLYIIGGFNIPVGSTAQTWQFDPTAAVGSRWLQRLDYPVSRSYIPTTAIGGMIYTGGGTLAAGSPVALTDMADSFKYDPTANTWTAIANIPRATGETRALAINNRMWVMGGGRTAPNPSNQVDIYNPTTNTWTTGLPFATARRNFPTDTDGSRVWLGGGYDSTGTGLLNTMEIFTVPLAQTIVSRKTHGAIGDFDIPLPQTGNVGIECRRGGGAGFNTHTVIANFAPATSVTVGGVTVTSSNGMATATQSVAGAVVTINLASVADAQTLMITLVNVNNGTTTGDVVIPMGILRGDTNADRFVNSGDSTQTRARSGQPTDGTNFRNDVNTDGSVNSGDSTVVRNNAGAFLP